jgi:hypothetical protein
MKKTFYFVLIILLSAGCQFSKSVKKDFVTGLVSSGDGLTCKEVYLSVNNEKTTRTTFTYGETAYLIFSDISGFTTENGNVFPSMMITVTDTKGDTMLFADNLYGEYTEGMNFSPLELTADLTIGTPIRSGNEYILKVNITDRKGSGNYNSAFSFRVESNPQLTTEAEGVTFNEAYVYSQESGKVISDGKINSDDEVYLIVEGLKGFREENQLAYPGLSLKITDAANNVILDKENLLSEYTDSGVSASELTARVSSHFKITGSDFKNPMNCQMIIWDNKSRARLTANYKMTIN